MMTDEEKTMWAEQYLRNKHDGLMITNRIVGHKFDPVEIISLADSLPNDPFVLAEMKRLNDQLPDESAILREIHLKALAAFDRGEEQEYFKGMRLYAEIRKMISKESKDSATGMGSLIEHRQMILEGMKNGTVL